MFIKRFKLFRLFGFDVHLDLSWFLIAILITWSLATSLFPQFYPDLSTSTYWWMGVIGALGLFASIVFHEFGHAIIARRFGVPMKGITLFIFGGVAEMEDEPPSSKAEFWVAVAGPIVSVVIAAACYALSLVTVGAVPEPITAVLWYLGLVNAVVVAFNLIPAFPLDGGRVLRSILWYFQGSLRRATRITSAIGSGFGMFLIALGILSIISGNFIGGLWQFLIGMFLRGAAQMSYQQVLIRRALEGEPIARFAQRQVHAVEPAMTIDDFVSDYIYKHHHKLYPVVQEGKLAGCVTIRDIKEVPREEWNDRTVGDVMQPCSEKNTIAPDADAMKALSQMNRDGQSRLMVVRDGNLDGIVTLKDMMNFIGLKIELEEDGDRPMTSRAVPGRQRDESDSLAA